MKTSRVRDINDKLKENFIGIVTNYLKSLKHIGVYARLKENIIKIPSEEEVWMIKQPRKGVKNVYWNEM